MGGGRSLDWLDDMIPMYVYKHVAPQLLSELGEFASTVPEERGGIVFQTGSYSIIFNSTLFDLFLYLCLQHKISIFPIVAVSIT